MHDNKKVARAGFLKKSSSNGMYFNVYISPSTSAVDK